MIVAQRRPFRKEVWIEWTTYLLTYGGAPNGHDTLKIPFRLFLRGAWLLGWPTT